MPQVISQPPPTILWDTDWLHHVNGSVGGAVGIDAGALSQPGGVYWSAPARYVLEVGAQQQDVDVGQSHDPYLRIGSNAGNALARFFDYPFRPEALPAGVPSLASDRVCIWSGFVRWVNPDATFGIMQGLYIQGNDASCRWSADAAPLDGNGMGICGNGAGGLQFIKKNAPQTGGFDTVVGPLAWPRAITSWTYFEFVLRSGTRNGAGTLEVWLDGVPFAGIPSQVWTPPFRSGGVAPATYHFNLSLRVGCNGLLHNNMTVQVKRLRFRAGRFLPNGVELTA